MQCTWQSMGFITVSDEVWCRWGPFSGELLILNKNDNIQVKEELMKKEVFCKTVKEEVGKWNMALLTHKIFNQQRFDHHSIDELYPDPNVVSTIIQYIFLRQNPSCFVDIAQKDILQLQSTISRELSIANFDLLGNMNSKSKFFIPRVMVIAYGISIIVKNLRLKFNTAIDPKEIFIILIYLSSGKLVSAKTFELAKNRMRTKKTALDRYSSFSTMQSNNQQNQSPRTVAPSAIHLFKEELKSALLTQKSQIQKQEEKYKMMQRRHAIQYKTKVLSTPISETIELFRFKSNRNENYKKKRILVRVSSNNRVSLDDGKTEKKSQGAQKGGASHKTHFFVQKKQLNEHILEKKRTLSLFQSH